jgi:NAD(P)-dependent dehydrogenase (short-subunit alcohol dehydrogenase family)
MRGLQDKTAVVTGGASGIGAATATRLAEEGATTVVTDIDTEGGTEVAEEIRDSGGTAKFHELDVTDYDEVAAVFEMVGEEYDGIDVLFNNAGIGEDRNFEDTTVEHRNRLVEVNLFGVWNGCRAVLPIMKETGGGVVVNTSSMAGWRPAYVSTYAIAKAGVLHLTKSLAHEFGHHDIRINAVCPGTIDTPMADQWFSEAALDAQRERIALGRLGNPEEIAAGVAFLASEESSFMTGRALKLDGGYA